MAFVDNLDKEPLTPAAEAEVRARAQELFDQSVALFSATVSKAIRLGGSRGHPLVQAAEVELNRVQAVITRLDQGTVPMGQFAELVSQINEATERLTRDMP